MEYEVKTDRTQPDTWRAEAIDGDADGLCYVTVFTGPLAELRAREYAAWKNGALG